MNHMNWNAQSVTEKCARFIKQHQPSLKPKDSIQPIQGKRHAQRKDKQKGPLTSAFTLKEQNTLYSIGTLQARSHKGFNASRLRIARVVAAVIGITLFLPMDQVSQASIMTTKSDLKSYTRSQLTGHQYKCVSQLWGKESAWNYLADNPDSSAFGIPQLLNMTTENPWKQINLGLKYIKHRYQTPCKALSFHNKHGWY